MWKLFKDNSSGETLKNHGASWEAEWYKIPTSRHPREAGYRKKHKSLGPQRHQGTKEAFLSAGRSLSKPEKTLCLRVFVGPFFSGLLRHPQNRLSTPEKKGTTEHKKTLFFILCGRCAFVVHGFYAFCGELSATVFVLFLWSKTRQGYLVFGCTNIT